MKTIISRMLPSRWREFLQSIRLNQSISKHQKRIVKHQYCGASLKIEIADGLAEGWYDRDWESLPELTLLETSRLKDGSRVFDIGAHQGVVGLILADRVGLSGKVVLVEANPHNARQCEKNIRLNEMQAVVVVEPIAIADKPGTLEFSRALNGSASIVNRYAGTFQVPCNTIDFLSKKFGYPEVVLLDVEGFECHALRGAVETLKRPIDWAIEIHVKCGLESAGGSVKEVLSFFPRERFKLFVHQEGSEKPMPVESADPILFSDRCFLTALCSSNAATT